MHDNSVYVCSYCNLARCSAPPSYPTKQPPLTAAHRHLLFPTSHLTVQ